MAKKKRRRGTRQPGVDTNEQRRQRLDARRQAKLEAETARLRKQRRERFIRRVIYVGIALSLVWFLFLRNRFPTEIAGHEVEHLSTAGGGEHTDGTVQYPTTPPVSGAHGAAAACGTHAVQIPNENQVHTLEHGAVGVQYAPDLDPEQIQQIEEIAREYDDHVFSAPYQGLDPPIAVTAWGFKMDLATVDAAAIREFIDEFESNGAAPEAANECPNTADDSFSVEAPPPDEDDGANATPAPEPSPTE